MNDLTLWMQTLNINELEQERFGYVDITKQMFYTPEHRAMVRQHEAGKEIRKLVGSFSPTEKPVIPLRRPPVLTEKQLEVARRVAETIRTQKEKAA